MKKTQKKLDFNGGWTMGEASRQIGKKYSQQVVPSKKAYNRTKLNLNL